MARKTVLVCDNCGKEVGEGKGAVMRLNFTDARRGSKQADLCDGCAGGMPGTVGRAPRPPAESRRLANFRSLHIAVSRRTKSRRGAGLRWADGALARRGAGTCRQSRAAPRAVPRRARARSLADRAEPRRRRAGRARPAAAARRRCSRAASARSTTSSRTSRPEIPERSSSRRSAARARRPARDRGGRSSTAFRRRPARPDSRTSSLSALGELESALVDPERVEGDLGRLAQSYRNELARLDLWDRDGLRRGPPSGCGATSTPGATQPVLAYGFEDLTSAEWALIEALAARDRRDRLDPVRARPRRVRGARADGRGPRRACRRRDRGAAARERRSTPAALAHLERGLFEDRRRPGSALDGSVHFLEGAGARGTVELSPSEILALVRAGTPPERIGVVCESVDRWRAPFETVLGPLGVPYAIEQRARLGETSLGAALLALLRFDWLGGGPRGAVLVPALAVLRARAAVGGLRRGPAARPCDRAPRAGRGGERRSSAELPSPRSPSSARTSTRCRRAGPPRLLVRNAWGLEAPPVANAARGDARAYERGPAGARRARGVRAACRWRRARARGASWRRSSARRWRPAAQARSRPRRRPRLRARADAIVRGRLPPRPRGGQPAETGAAVAAPRRLRAARARRPPRAAGPVARDRYLFYTACTRRRQRLVLVREAATDEGSPREPSPFWDDVRALFAPDDVAHATRRRPLSSAHVAARGRAERARAPARARRAAPVADEDGAAALAAANGWARRLERRAAAFERPTSLRSPAVLESLGEPDDLLGDRARALRGLLLRLARRAGDRSEDDRRRARRDAPGPGRAHGPAPLLRGACRASSTPSGSRQRTSTRRSSSSAAASTTRSSRASAST